tara:strand:- start:811 stop:1212 length:402 start_codon:yes stop_codon:yes gene_type:complete
MILKGILHLKTLQIPFTLFSNKQVSDNDTKLVTFRVPFHIVNNFDELVKFKRGTRTSYLVGMMDTFIRSEVKRLKETNRINEFISDIRERNTVVEPLTKTKQQLRKTRTDYDETYYEPPMLPSLGDGFGWTED